MHSLLHCHFESALRALAVARPWDIEHARVAFESRAYARATPAARLSLLDRQVTRLTQDRDIFTRKVFTEVVRRLGEEMANSGIRHVDLRVGVLMHRWPWIGTLADAIGALLAGLPGPDTLTVSFLGAVNLSKPHEQLDLVFGRILEDTAAEGLLTGC
jgi:adenosine deaminase